MVQANYWGPSTWTALHSMSFAMKPAEFKGSKAIGFLQALVHMLPCTVCRRHMTEYISVTNPVGNITTLKAYQQYLYKFHKHVNDAEGKPSPSYADVERLYSDVECCRLKGAPDWKLGTLGKAAGLLVLAAVIAAVFIGR